MRKLLFLLLMSVSVVISAADKIVLATPLGAPLSLSNQQGFVDLIVAEALLRNGKSLQVAHLPAERALINANSGIDDGDMNRIGGLDKFYTNLIQVSEKTFSMEFTAFSRTVNFKTSDWNSLKPYSVGIINGWKILEKNVPESVELIKVKNPQQLFSLLSNNRVDVILFGKWQGLNYINKNNIKGVKLLQPALAGRDMFVYFHKKHKDLVPLFTQSLREMKKEGVYKRIFDQTLKPLIQ